VNRFVTRHIVKITASQNTEQEHIGMLNGVARYAYAFRQFCEGIKNRQRALYYTAKWTIFAALAYLISIR
jgi:beta-hydroxylase